MDRVEDTDPKGGGGAEMRGEMRGEIEKRMKEDGGEEDRRDLPMGTRG